MGADGKGWEAGGWVRVWSLPATFTIMDLKKQISRFSLPNYGQKSFAVPGSAVSVLQLLITMQSVQNTGHPALLLHTWMVSIN